MRTTCDELAETSRRNDCDTLASELGAKGFVVWRKLLPQDLIDAHLAAFEALLEHLGVPCTSDGQFDSRTNVNVQAAQAQFHWDHSAPTQLLFNPRLLEFLRWLFEDEAVMRQASTSLFERRTSPHVDSGDLRAEPHGSEVRMWCALETVRSEAGPVYYIEGSHKRITEELELTVLREKPDLVALLKRQLGATTVQEFSRTTQPLWSYVMETLIPRWAKEMDGSKVVPMLEKGDVVLFSPYVIHGTSPCTVRGARRESLVCYWSGKHTYWHSARSYWGTTHDYRAQDNRITAPIERTSLGYRMAHLELYRSLFRSFGTPIH